MILGVEFVELGIGSGLGWYWRVREIKDLDLGLVTRRKIDEHSFQVELGDKLMPSIRANSKDFGKRTVSSPDGTQHASRKITFTGSKLPSIFINRWFKCPNAPLTKCWDAQIRQTAANVSHLHYPHLVYHPPDALIHTGGNYRTVSHRTRPSRFASIEIHVGSCLL